MKILENDGKGFKKYIDKSYAKRHNLIIKSIIKSRRKGTTMDKLTINKLAKKVLVVVDMQQDFINGALGTKEAEAIVDNVAEVIKTFDGETVKEMLLG